MLGALFIFCCWLLFLRMRSLLANNCWQRPPTPQKNNQAGQLKYTISQSINHLLVMFSLQ